MNDDNLTGEVLPMIDRGPLQGARNGSDKFNRNLGLRVNSFTPGPCQTPISLRCVEPGHMADLGYDHT
jgi:hypothetical protein